MNHVDTQLYGTDLFGGSMAPKVDGALKQKYTVPPFSTLSARDGDWQERKRAWVGIGIESEVGRSELGNTYNSVTSGTKEVSWQDNQGISIFDPVICELAYKWFCPPGGQVVDPFSGGSVRGIVAAKLGRLYWGCDLRDEQIKANREQGVKLCGNGNPEWHLGDATVLVPDAPRPDFLFTCPPYGDLESYSDDPKDLSSMSWRGFCAAYAKIIAHGVYRLKTNRFACFVVGNFRDKDGYMRDLVGATVQAFEAAGARLYNEAILLTAVGTACIRASAQFKSGMKLCKVHQNVLVFCKGDWEKAAALIELQ